MDRFEYSAPTLGYGETALIRANNVRIYDGETKTSYEGGEIILTSHRLFWGHAGDFDQGTICLALLLRYVVFIEEETPSAFAFTRSSKLVLHLSPQLPDKGQGPVQISLNNYIKLSFKDGLDNAFVREFRNTLSAKRWEVLPNLTSKPSSTQKPSIKPRTGIVGIERGIQEKQKATEESISVAFQDLSKLMHMAKEMVNVSKIISNKIREKQGSITEDETIQFKSYLLSLGIDDPVTRDSVSSEDKYLDKLGQEIIEILELPIKEQGGMMSLIDGYCRVNRARGMELVSPEDLLRAASRLTIPLKLREFESGVKVLQLSEHDDAAVIKDTEDLIKCYGSLTAQELAHAIGISLLLAKERLLTAEKFAKACRDESVEGLRFYPNLFLEKENTNTF